MAEESKYAGTIFEYGCLKFRARHGNPDQRAEASRELRKLGTVD
jgi:hypothetical protein